MLTNSHSLSKVLSSYSAVLDVDTSKLLSISDGKSISAAVDTEAHKGSSFSSSSQSRIKDTTERDETKDGRIGPGLLISDVITKSSPVLSPAAKEKRVPELVDDKRQPRRLNIQRRISELEAQSTLSSAVSQILALTESCAISEAEIDRLNNEVDKIRSEYAAEVTYFC